MNNIDDIYLELCRNLLKAPKVGNTRELNNVKIVLNDITKNVVSVRGLSPSYLFGELLWYFNSDNSLEFISQFSSFWDNLSDDGITCNSAYGYLIGRKHGFNQVKKVIDILKRDPNSRRAKINLNVPNAAVIETRDEPCTMSLHFMIRDGKLECTTVMRSNDIWFGFPYDVAFFTEVQKYIADQLGVKYGKYTHFAVSLHMYDRDAEKITNVVTNPISKLIVFDSKRLLKYSTMLYLGVKRDMEEGSNDIKKKLLRRLKTYGIYEG